jgi:hypothetical protein
LLAACLAATCESGRQILYAPIVIESAVHSHDGVGFTEAQADYILLAATELLVENGCNVNIQRNGTVAELEVAEI